MRLTNERDQEILRAGISDAAASLLEFMTTMGTGEAIVFGEGVALPTRIKFDMLPDDALPKSNTASFTKNWAMDMPEDTFMQEIVNRWRAQSHNPDGAGYSVETALAAPAPMTPPFQQPAAVAPVYSPPPAHPSLRRQTPAPGGLGPAPQQPPAAQPPAQQQSLANLIRQFRS